MEAARYATNLGGRLYERVAGSRSLCNSRLMATNLKCDDRLIEEARRIGRHKTKKDAVTAALVEYMQRRRRLRILGAFGTVDFDPAYDYKAAGADRLAVLAECIDPSLRSG